MAGSMSEVEFEQLRMAANAGIRFGAQNLRENTLNAAVRDGRIARASVPEWRAKYNDAPAATKKALEALPAGRVAPSAPRASVAAAQADEAHAQFMSQRNPGVVRRLAARAAGRNVEVQRLQGR